MATTLQTALAETDPFEFLWAAMASYPYSRPEDFPRLNTSGQTVVATVIFANVFCAGGYGVVIDQLRDLLPSVARALSAINADPFAAEMRRIEGLLESEKLSQSSGEDRWIAFSEKNRDFSGETQRDLPGAAGQIAAALRQHILSHPEVFLR